MSELKVHKAYNRWIDEEMPTPNDDLICNEVYLKYEADKVINHYKYKRCLAMARIAQDDWHIHNSFYAMGHQEFEKRKCKFYDKWRNRWLKIAEQFKEAK